MEAVEAEESMRYDGAVAETRSGRLAPGNRDLFAHFSRTFGDNADPEALLAVLRAEVSGIPKA